MATVMMDRARGVRIAQDHGEPAIDRRQHEAGRNEGAKAQHRENKRRGPVAPTTVSQSIRTSRSHVTSAFTTLTCVVQPAGNTPQLLCIRSARDRNAPQTSSSRNLLVGSLGTSLYYQAPSLRRTVGALFLTLPRVTSDTLPA